MCRNGSQSNAAGLWRQALRQLRLIRPSLKERAENSLFHLTGMQRHHTIQHSQAKAGLQGREESSKGSQNTLKHHLRGAPSSWHPPQGTSSAGQEKAEETDGFLIRATVLSSAGCTSDHKNNHWATSRLYSSSPQRAACCRAPGILCTSLPPSPRLELLHSTGSLLWSDSPQNALVRSLGREKHFCHKTAFLIALNRPVRTNSLQFLGQRKGQNPA